MNDRITIRLGPLAEPLKQAAEKSGRTPSEEVRYRLSRSLRVPAPRLQQGYADPAVQERAQETHRKKRKANR